MENIVNFFNGMVKPEFVKDFTAIELIKFNARNRCTAYAEGVKAKEELRKAKEEGHPEKVIKASTIIIRKLYESLKKKGFMHINPIRAFWSNGVLYLLDGHHLFRALLEIYYETGVIMPFPILVFSETDGYGLNLDQASEMMCEMNKDGSVKWSFLDIIGSINSELAGCFRRLYAKYGGNGISIDILANAILDVDRDARREEIDTKWKDDSLMTANTEKHAIEYLDIVESIRLNKKVSKDCGNAIRALCNLARNRGVLDLFASYCKEIDIEVSFATKGRVSKNMWLYKLTSAMSNHIASKCTKFSAYTEANQNIRRKYRNFVAEAVSMVDVNEVAKKVVA